MTPLRSKNIRDLAIRGRQAQTAGALAPCCLWYIGFGCQSFRLSALHGRQWLDKQTRSLLPDTYYHWVFTLPTELNCGVLDNQHKVYPLLFDCAAQSLLEFRHNRLPGAISDHCHAAYVGADARLPSTSSLDCHRRSIKSRWQTVALAQTAEVPLSGTPPASRTRG
jgi:hypothetical protein